MRSGCESPTCVVSLTLLKLCPLTSSARCVHISDSPHCEPPLVEEPAPDTVSVSHNSEDGA